MVTIVAIMNTTIQISKETKELISSFGSKEDTYEEIIKRMYRLAVNEHLRDFLLSSEDAMGIDQAIDLSKRKWQK